MELCFRFYNKILMGKLSDIFQKNLFDGCGAIWNLHTPNTVAEAYSEPCQTMELFVKMVNTFSNSANSSILDVWQDSE